MITIRGIALLFTSALVAGAACASGAPTAGELLQHVNTKGAKAVYEQELTGVKWTAFLASVETGQRSWLELVAAIYPVTDGGASASLTLSLGAALEKAPRDVLLITGKVVPLEGTCGFPDLEDPPTDTKQETVAWLDARITAVSKVSSIPELKELSSSCLGYLRAAKAEVTGSDSPFGK